MKTKIITIRFTPDQLEIIDKARKDANISDFIRDSVLQNVEKDESVLQKPTKSVLHEESVLHKQNDVRMPRSYISLDE